MASIVQNLEKAIEIISAIPKNQVDLSSWKHPCGTIACAAGWLASDPYFNAQGMSLVTVLADNKKVDFYYLPRDNDPRFDHTGAWEWLDALFGDNAYNSCFAEFGQGVADDYILHDIRMSDKQLAVARLERQLTLEIIKETLAK